MSDALPLSTALTTRLGGRASLSLEEALRALFRTGQQAWPTVPLQAEDFVAHLAACLSREPPGADEITPALLDKIIAADLYLACACAAGIPQALGAFETAFLSQVPAMVSHINRSPAFTDEVCQVLRVNLLVGSDGERPRISEYAGRGALHSWLRIAAVRVALRLSRRHVVDGQDQEGPDGVDALPEPALGPELAHIKARYRTEFKEALEQALATLSSQQRNVLRLQVRAGLTSDQIAALYKVNRSTVTRWLSAARSAVLTETQRLLQERLHLSPSEFRSLAAVVYSQLDLSLSRVLPAEPEE